MDMKMRISFALKANQEKKTRSFLHFTRGDMPDFYIQKRNRQKYNKITKFQEI